MALNFPIEPPQSNPPLIGLGSLFSRDWYLFFRNILKWLRLQPIIVYGTLDPDQKPTGLTASDDGVIFVATDYKHRYRWNGTALDWEWDYAENGAEYIVAGEPSGGLWQLCDGTTVDVAQSDGTLSAIAVPDMVTGDPMIQGTPTTSGQRVSTRATWETGAKTADEAAHTHSVHVLDSSNFETGIFPAVTDQSVLSGPGSAHSHNLTDALSQLKKFSEADGGMPLRIPVSFYYRR